jgi:hypothetical protein
MFPISGVRNFFLGRSITIVILIIVKRRAVLLRLRNSEWIGWLLIDHVDGVRRLRTAAITRPIVHPPGDVWTWTVMVVTMSAGKTRDSSTRALWQSYQQRHMGADRSNGRKSENFAYYYLRYVSRSVTCRKILTTWYLRLPLRRKVCCGLLSPLKNPSPRPCLNPRPLGTVASTATTTPPRRKGVCVSICVSFSAASL